MSSILLCSITLSSLLIWGARVALVTEDWDNFIPILLLISLVVIILQVSQINPKFQVDNKEQVILCCFFLGGGCLGMTGVFAAMWFLDEIYVIPEVVWLRIVELALMLMASIFGFKCMYNLLKGE